MSAYRLAQHTSVCVTPQGAVFLDVKRDAYFAIDMHQSQALCGLVDGWPNAGPAVFVTDESQALAAQLYERGLLVRAPQGHALRDTTLATVTEELIAWQDMRLHGLRAHHILAFVRAVAVALFTLHVRSFFAAVCRVERACESAPRTLSVEKMQHLVSIYSHMRVFVFARRGRCLFDSVVLMEFLAAYGLTPQWVIAVRLRPFSAHSWVQHERWVLNGTVGFVRTFRPILVV